MGLDGSAGRRSGTTRCGLHQQRKVQFVRLVIVPPSCSGISSQVLITDMGVVEVAEGEGADEVAEGVGRPERGVLDDAREERVQERDAAAEVAAAQEALRVHRAVLPVEAARDVLDGREVVGHVALRRVVEASEQPAQETGEKFPTLPGSYLDRVPFDLAHFWTSDHLSGQTQGADAFFPWE